jgi:hypothetical protein
MPAGAKQVTAAYFSTSLPLISHFAANEYGVTSPANQAVSNNAKPTIPQAIHKEGNDCLGGSLNFTVHPPNIRVCCLWGWRALG